MVKRLSIFVALVFGGLAFSSLPAQAQEPDVLIQTGIITNSWQAQDEVTFSELGPVDLSGSDHATGNVGERVMLGTLDLEDGEWTITASVRLFVPDPDPAANDGRGTWKNSQGCGLYADGEQIGGAGGSSSLWTATADGKEVVFDTFLVPPNWEDVPIALDGPATVELECFIDQSHSGAQLEQRTGMAATDISITAVRTPEPTQTPTAEPSPSPTPEPSASATSSPEPSETPAAGAGGSDKQGLPVTGFTPLPLALGGLGLIGTGGGLIWWLTRRRAPTFTA